MCARLDPRRWPLVGPAVEVRTMPTVGINTRNSSVNYEIALISGGNIPTTNKYTCKYKSGENFNGVYNVKFDEGTGNFSGTPEDGQIQFANTLLFEITTINPYHVYVVELGIYSK